MRKRILKVKEQEDREIMSKVTYGDHRFLNDHAAENPRANPDLLSETDGFWLTNDITKEVQGRVEKLMQVSKQILTEQQYKVFVLLAVKDPPLNQREAAKLLGLTRGRINQLWQIARKKMEKAYEQRT